MNYRDYLESENPLAFALMAKMNYNRREQVRLKADFLRLILGSRIDEARRSLLVEFVETYVPLMGNDLIEFQELIHTENQYEKMDRAIRAIDSNERLDELLLSVFDAKSLNEFLE